MSDNPFQQRERIKKRPITSVKKKVNRSTKSTTNNSYESILTKTNEIEEESNSNLSNESTIILPKIPSPFEGRLKFTPKTIETNNSFFNRLLNLSLLLILSSYFLWYRYHTIQLGYCNSEKQVKEKPSYFDFLLPTCIPCPKHAVCQNHQIQYCKKGYILLPHPMNSKLFPLSASCVIDLSQVLKINQLYLKSLEKLKENAGLVKCYGEKKFVREEYLKFDDVKKLVLEKGIKHDTDLLEFNTLFEKSYQQLLVDDDILKKTIINKEGQEIILIKSKIEKYSIYCQLKLIYLKWMKIYYKEILFLNCLMAALIYFYYKYQIYCNEKMKVNQLYHQVIQELIDRDHLSLQNPSKYPENSIGINLLRDHLLTMEYKDINQRQYIWNQVCQLIENNSNIRKYQKDIKGDDHHVWEWIGDSLTFNKLNHNNGELGIKKSNLMRVSDSPINGNEDEGDVEY
ncbi:hypothetical protein K502DRAFT_340893 [Neoconidiobolus thromboides FSU 785]|nr:hypothetical protein K502DRAFT_340893 [Neoconidiobolus thromboides FSU 785]